MGFARRIEKLRRLARWRLAAGAPLWWHVGRPNFGDDINPTFFRAISGQPMRFAPDRRLPHLLGAGSILAKATPASVVCGSGFLEPPGGGFATPAEVVAVRGECSQVALGCRADVALGDPLVLVGDVTPTVEKRHRFGLVPHVLSIAEWRARNTHGLHLIDPGHEPWSVIGQIAACETILSQSLHGLIVADALGIPNVWIAPSDGMVGGRFKFDDYFSTLDHPKEAVPETRELFARPEVLVASVGMYRHSKPELRQALVRACHQVADRR